MSKKELKEYISSIKGIVDCSETTKNHITKAISEGFTNGEVHEDFLDSRNELYSLNGWWWLANGKVAVELDND